jgi:baculoviral IAP repeat-containing protein 6
VLVSIQSLILVPDPYFNEPGYESSMGTPNGIARSNAYNRNIRVGTLRHAMCDVIESSHPDFEDVINAHFRLKKNEILQQSIDWVGERHEVHKRLSKILSKY